MRTTTLWSLIVLSLTTVLFAGDDEIAATFTYPDAHANNVEVAGEFSNWKAIPLAKDATGTWTKTLYLKPGTYGYKLIVNGEWMFDPNTPARKTVNDIENSAITVGNAAAPASTAHFAFTDAKAKAVYVAGDFNDWLNPTDGKIVPNGQWLMQNDGAGNWTLAADLKPGKHQFKYVIDGGERWEKDPTKPVVDDNSVIEVTGAAGVPAPAAGNTTFTVAAPDAKSVAVAGDFNKWSATATPLQKDATGLWTGSVSLKPGKYQYKLVVDGNWQGDPTAAETADDGFGGKNSVKVVEP